MNQFPFLSDNSEASELIKSIDWSSHEMGTVENWPPCLKVSLGLVTNSLQPMFIWWGKNHIQFYNDEYVKSFGKGKHPRAMGQKGEECWPEIWPVIYPQIQDVLTTRKPNWYVNQRLAMIKEEKIVDTYWSYGHTPIIDENGDVRGVMVICNETTDYVKAVKSINKANNQLKEFVEQSPVGIAVLKGPKLIYKTINPAFIELMGCGKKADDFIGKNLKEVYPEVEGQGFYELIDEVYRTGKPFNGSKYHIVLDHHDGSKKDLFINFSFRPKINYAGRITGVISYIYEVTDQVNEKKEFETITSNLKEAVLVRDNFLGIASHELTTPLTTIKLQTQFHKKYLNRRGMTAEVEPKIHTMLDNTIGQTNRISRLVEDMLDVARISSGKLTIKKAEADLSMLLEDTLERFTPQLEAAGCSIDKNIEKDIKVDVDAVRIEQVLSNLFTNVIKYAPGKPVHVRLIKGMNKVRVSVEDEGKGILPQNAEKIFGRFERASANSDISGMGLGLYISKQIIQDHGGLIYVESRPGRGAKFNVELPKYMY